MWVWQFLVTLVTIFSLKKVLRNWSFMCQFEFDIWIQVEPRRQVGCSRCPRFFSTVERWKWTMNWQVCPDHGQNSRLNCLKESWLVWRNLSGKTCLRCPLVSWKRQVQKVKKVKNKIGRNIRLAMWQANLSDVNSRMIYKEHEQRIIKTSAEASYQGCRINPNAGHQMPRTGIVKAHSHEPQKKNCSFLSLNCSPCQKLWWVLIIGSVGIKIARFVGHFHLNTLCAGMNRPWLTSQPINAPDSFILETIKLAFFLHIKLNSADSNLQKKLLTSLTKLGTPIPIYKWLVFHAWKHEEGTYHWGRKWDQTAVCLFKPWDAESKKVRSEHSVAVWFSQVISQAFPTVFFPQRCLHSALSLTNVVRVYRCVGQCFRQWTKSMQFLSEEMALVS